MRPVEGPFALTLHQGNTDRLHCLNTAALGLGLAPGMGLADARALCPGLVTRPAAPEAEAAFLRVLARWAGRYCPWVGVEGADGLVMDVTGSTHLWGGEEAMIADMRAAMAQAGIALRVGLAETRGAAWALAHHAEGIAPSGRLLSHLGPLPPAALRLPPETCAALARLGLRRVADLAGLPRASLARRFGPEVLMRLDQALGARAEEVAPLPDPPHYGTRLTLPEPIGLLDDVMAGTGRLLAGLCARLKAEGVGARHLRLTLRRVDQASREVELRLAAPMREAARILPLFQRGLSEVDAGFGIDQMRLVALQVEPLPPEQIAHHSPRPARDLEDLITRIGARIGLEKVQRFLPADSHVPERAFLIAPAAFSQPPQGGWPMVRPRPLRLFPPEPIAARGPAPPRSFRWRRMALTTARATGPERIAPEWWMDDPAWSRGLRDYWRIDTRQGRRLWLFHTPQMPGWFVQGEFA